MPINLPLTPAPREITPRLITARSELRPAWGGPVQRQVRAGSRWAFDVQMPPMTAEQAREWCDLLTEDDTVVLPLKPFLPAVAGLGGLLVKGASQEGATLLADGAIPYGVIGKGAWVSIVQSSGRYVYQVRAECVDDDGEISIPIRPLIRRSPGDNNVIEAEAPRVEGFVTLPDGAMRITVDRLVHGLSFTIEERE